jgi:GT2 family glycosyltransferase/2-polyprenyl-3-methyl-5-hydroxy-6-metoxy-1,4-benzoquinol methylase/tetratricopeptide (TPR) repeat protein
MEKLLAVVAGKEGQTGWLDGGSVRNGLLQDPGYYEHVRPELLELVPKTARWVLDVGCGAGSLGAALKRRQEVRVVGVEFCQDVAQRAKSRLDEVHVGDVEALDFSFADGLFDAIVCGDVLEHLRDPAKFLVRARDWLSPEGQIIASIPNARNHSLVGGLVQGNWTYQTAGLLDRTHLRFFTRREIEKLFFRTGYRVDTLGVVPGPGYQEWHEQGEPGNVPLGPITLSGLPPEEAAEFYAYQYLVSAKPARRGPATVVSANGSRPVGDFGLTSIVILTFNQLGYTRQCLASIAHSTDEDYEIIVVDNGSTDGTPDYLRSLPNVKLIENATNRGFPAAANQGIKAAKGRQVLLLNNDTVVTTGWLWRLLDALYSDPKIGMVGPSSNNVSGPQQIPVAYRDLDGIDGFAWEWGRANHRKLEETQRLVGFCMLIRREVIDRIGLLDERFGIGTFEDDDYCIRAALEGYRLSIVRGAFVHHFGSATFNGNGVNGRTVLEENQKRFVQKWSGAPIDAPKPKAADVADAKFGIRDGEGPLLLTRAKVRLSLCMIVRNNEGTLGPALASVYPWVDEVVIVDTGSTDETIAVAESYGARVFHFPWCDDFSAARNESISHATGEWLFWMDSDDTIPPEEGRKLQGYIKAHNDDRILGYVMQVHCPGKNRDDHTDIVAVDHLKLFRNRPDIRFEGRIHEQLLPAIRSAGGVPAWTDGYVVHSGSDKTPEGLRKKVERDLRILHKDLEERPDHPFVLFNMGMTYADIRETETAVKHLRRCLEVSSREESHVRKAHALLVTTYMHAGQNDEAWAACQNGLKDYPDDRELLFLAGSLHLHFGRLRQAEQTYRLLLATKVERHFTSVMKGLDGFRARHNLARVYEEMGNEGKADAEWRVIVGEAPDYREGWRSLAESLLRQARIDEVAKLAVELQAERAISHPSLRCEGALIRARISERSGDKAASREQLEQIVEEFPRDAYAVEQLAKAYCESLDAPGTVERLKGLATLADCSPGIWFYIGMAYFHQMEWGQTIEAFQRSIAFNPSVAQGHLWLGHAWKESGDRIKAKEAYERAAKLEPYDAIIQASLAAICAD